MTRIIKRTIECICAHMTVNLPAMQSGGTLAFVGWLNWYCGTYDVRFAGWNGAAYPGCDIGCCCCGGYPDHCKNNTITLHSMVFNEQDQCFDNHSMSSTELVTMSGTIISIPVIVVKDNQTYNFIISVWINLYNCSFIYDIILSKVSSRLYFLKQLNQSSTEPDDFSEFLHIAICQNK